MELGMIVLVGLAAGVLGTGSGGLLAILSHRRMKMSLGTLLGLSGGVMLAVVFYELIPEALEEGGFLVGMSGLLLGVALMLMIDVLLPHVHLSGNEDKGRAGFVRTGMLLGMGIALHNLPEGLAIGTSLVHDESLGLTLAAVIALHNLPEGMAMAIPLSAGRLSPLKVWGYTLLAGLPMGVGALFGGMFGRISPMVLSIGLGFAAGAMLYITCDELIPGAQEHAKGHSATFGLVVGVLIGLALLGAH